MSNDGSLLLFDMQKINISERFIRRTFNLCHSNMQSRQKLTTFSDENFTTTFVKIGLEYQAITNDYSLSQIKDQKSVQILFSMTTNQTHVKLQPKNIPLWVFHNKAVNLEFKDIYRFGSLILRVKSIKTPEYDAPKQQRQPSMMIHKRNNSSTTQCRICFHGSF